MHPLIVRAADGALPEWAEASRKRREHVQRVSDLLETWAGRLRLDPRDASRWRAAGILHDALRDADPESLRRLVSPELQDLPPKMLHGPAVAARLREEGVADDPLLLAIAWHTLGHPGFDALGKALYLADYTEPGRDYESPDLAAKRERVPSDMEGVLREVATDRIGRSLRRGRPLLQHTVHFWNSLVGR